MTLGVMAQNKIIQYISEQSWPQIDTLLSSLFTYCLVSINMEVSSIGWQSALRKHAYANKNYVENFTSKTENFQIKPLIFFIFLLKT